MLEPGFPVAETDMDTWWQTWEVNVKVSRFCDLLTSGHIPSHSFLPDATFVQRKDSHQHEFRRSASPYSRVKRISKRKDGNH